MLDGVQHREQPQDMVAFIDYKGDEWQLAPLTAQICKKHGVWRQFWLVIVGPPALTVPPYRYDVIDTEIFTEWFTNPSGGFLCGDVL